MLTRRTVLRSAGVLGLATPLLAGCGGTEPTPGGPSRGPSGGTSADTELVSSKIPRAGGSKPDATATSKAITEFTSDLFAKLASKSGNLVCSPYSVVVALAMTRNGATGETAAEMDKVLHVSDLDKLNTGLNWLDQELGDRAGERKRLDETKATVGLDVANSLWGQRGITWQRKFLDSLARDYGTGMRQVDYAEDTEGARRKINSWTAEATRDKIPEIIPAGILKADSRLVLVNAIWFKAPWEETFEKALTTKAPFTRSTGEEISVDTMSASLLSSSYAEGPGYVAASLPYAGRELAMAVIVPTGEAQGQAQFTGDLTELLGSFQPSPVQLTMPRWKFRTAAPLKAPLTELGMPRAFSDDAEFDAMTTEVRLQIAEVLHQGFIAVDEAGTEAAAATAVVMRETSARVDPTPVVKADRTFTFVIYDVATTTPLFIGRVDDPR